eukprot:TRINITY_DN3243_c0_g1_i2.p1 TRINITY_DN3243_c0_g1~~TRINITY_DN3243_c0_g1_i2.p1  ORF type:complete len:375 (-),score=66.42 TRINITY_DN3243_c0_g1_i2:57-1181(-)
MKALRDRLKMNLSISTANPKGGGGGGGASGQTMLDNCKGIRDMPENQFAKLYTIGEEVMESTNRGMRVLFATRVADGMEVVIKVRERSKSFGSPGSEREWCATTEVQMNIPKTDTMCQFLDVVRTPTNYYVVMEKVEGQDLFEQMNKERIRHADAREIVFQILEAVNTLHERGRIHKDLKLENVMVDMNAIKEPSSPGAAKRFSQVSASPKTKGKQPLSPSSPGVKIIDFDTVLDWEPSSPKARDVLGTDGYIAPEAYSGEYSPASDIFCVGVIMYKLLTRRFPYKLHLFDDKPGENVVGNPAMLRIQERLRNETIDFQRPPFTTCRQALSLCSAMLAFDANERPSAKDALEHEWFKMLPGQLVTPRGSADSTR